VRLDRFQIASQTASLVVAGSVGAGATVGERPLDLRVTARALPTESGRTRAAGADIERLVLDVTAKGPLAAPAVNGTVDAARVRLPQGSLDRLQAKLSMTPVPAGGFELALDADATGVAPADRAIAQAIGNRVSVDAKGRVDPEGVLAVEGARVATGTAEASFSGRVGSAVLDGTLKARVPSLAPFSGIAGRRLGGSADLTARLTGDPSRSTFSAMLDAALANPATGLPALDGLLGAKATASGTVTRIPDGFSLGDFRINGAHAAGSRVRWSAPTPRRPWS
jgi:translocation and assembly module TamB